MTEVSDPIEATTRAVTALLVSISRNPIGSPTQTFISAIRRHGHAHYDAGGADALGAVLARIRDETADERAADIRTRVVTMAWEGIAEPKDESA